MSRRVLLKLSGEVLGGETGQGLDPESFTAVASMLAPISASGVQVAVVVGGGNLCRGGGLEVPGLPATTAHTAGMLATVMNGLLLNAALRRAGASSEVYTPWPTGGETTLFSAREARALLASGGIAILAGGTWNPFFTTDTCAALRALELECSEVLKATKVDGIYTADPQKDPSAQRISRISFSEVLEKGLEVMDAAAVALCREHRMPIRVFSMTDKKTVERALCGEDVGTVVHAEPNH